MKMSREFKIGFFGVAMIACLYWGVNFLKGTDIFTRSSTYYAVYDQVNGIQPSSAIVIKGFKVGTITNISYDPVKSNKVILEFAVRSKFKIPENSEARIFSDGLMGGKAVEILLGTATTNLHSGDTLISSADKGFLEVAGSELEFLKQRATDVVNRVIVTLDGINTILATNSSNINTTVNNLASLTGNINSIVESEEGSLRSTLENFNTLSMSLKEKSGQIDNIITNAENFSDSLSKSQIPTMIAELTTTLSTLNSTLEKVNRGEGTVGKFMTDEALYDSLVTTSGNLSALLEDLKKNPKRYINVSIFGGKDKSAK